MVMRHRQHRTAAGLSVLLALLSLAPAGLLRPAPAPCAPGPATVSTPAASCGGCCEGRPVKAPVSLSCGCCASDSAPAPVVLPAPVAPLAAPSTGDFVATPTARRLHGLELGPARREVAPPARLLHCVHLI